MAKTNLERNRCGLCGKPKERVKKLIIGLHGAVCSDCIDFCIDILSHNEASLEITIHARKSLFGKPQSERNSCGLCGKTKEQVKRLIVGLHKAVCSDCIDLCNDILYGASKGNTSTGSSATSGPLLGHSTPLRRNHLADDPIAQFKAWLTLAETSHNLDPYAMALATVRPDGTPAVRMVLLKVVNEDGFIFCSHYNGPKSEDIAAHPHASLCFYWPELQRQVRISGSVEKIDPEESDRLFFERPKESRLAATLGGQSRPIETREEIDRRFDEAVKGHESKAVQRPETWGGFRIRPTRIEFWQSGKHRLHDRFLYERDGEGWKITRLAP